MDPVHDGDKRKLLVVEDDPDQAQTMKRMLVKRFSADIDLAPDLASAREALSGREYDVVVTDYQLPDGSGLELLEEITSKPTHPRVIMVTGQGGEDIAAEAFRLRASGYVVKDTLMPAMFPEIMARTLNEVSLREAEDELLISQQNQRALLDATSEVLLLVDRRGVILTINEAGAERLGGTVDEMIGKPLADYLDAGLAEDRRARFDTVVKTYEPIRFEDQSDGVVQSNVLYPVIGKNGKVTRVAVFSRDITERKKSEEAVRKAHEELEERVLERTAQLRKSNEELRREIEERKRVEESLRALSQSVQEQARVLDQILSASPQHYYLFDNRGKFIYASAQAADLLGLEQSAFSGKYWRELGLPGDVMTRLDIEREKVLVTAEPWKGRMKFPTVAGLRDFEYILSPIVRPDGKVDTVVAAVRDVTDETASQTELEARAARLQEQAQFLDLTREPVMVRDVRGRVAYWNAGAVRTWGWSRAEAMGKVQSELLKTEFPVDLEELEDILLEEGHWEGELAQVTRDGRRLVVSSRQVVRWSQGRQPDAILEIDYDISDRRLVESELEERIASLERMAGVLDLLGEPVIVTDIKGVVESWSAGAERLFGWAGSEALGKVANELLSAAFDVPIADIERELLDKGCWEGPVRIKAKDGAALAMDGRWSLQTEQSEPASIVQVFTGREARKTA
jgi:PAS domain S-box-containing protein